MNANDAERCALGEYHGLVSPKENGPRGSFKRDGMTSPNGKYFNIGRGLALIMALLVALILGGNGLVIYQFKRAQLQTDRLTGVSQQLIAVLRLQESLRLFHQRLNELAQSKDAHRLVTEVEPLRASLQKQTQQTRSTLAYLPPAFHVAPAFLTALDTIEVTLPFQLDDIASLAEAGDWEVVRLRLDDELKRIETTTSDHVQSINRELDEELPQAVANMKSVQRRIFLIVPLTAISTVLVAAFFGWAIARRILELRLEERLNERTRIARALHDTLLQSFQGLVIQLQVVDHLLPPGKAKERLEHTLELADQAIAEGRDAVQDLRSSATTTNDLSQAVMALCNELATPDAPAFRLTAEGSPRNLHPIIRDEIYRIAREALRNAFSHAHAQNIEAELIYADRLFRLRIRDDGTGIEPAMLEAGRTGHYGLPGMRERARQIGAEFTIWSGVGTGTEIDLSIPGSIAYHTLPRPRFGRLPSRLSR
jgi:signal transduction histidine kinase